MDRSQAMEYVSSHFIDDSFDDDGIAIVKIRHYCDALPDVGANGLRQDNCEWAFIDMNEKIDTGEYGCVYYFGTREQVKDIKREEAMETIQDCIDKIHSALEKIGVELNSLFSNTN